MKEFTVGLLSSSVKFLQVRLLPSFPHLLPSALPHVERERDRKKEKEEREIVRQKERESDRERKMYQNWRA